LTGAGSLGVRLGHIGQQLNNINALLGGSLTVDGRATDVSETAVAGVAEIAVDFAAGTAQYALVDSLQSQLASYQGSASGFKTYLKGLAQALLIKMVDDDSPLASKDVTSALRILIGQMAGVSSVKANVPALGSQTAVGSPTGSPGIVASVKSGAGTYSGMEYALAETIRFSCVTDAQSGTASGNQEKFTATGKVAIADPLTYNWPGGSGASQSYTVVDPQLSNLGGNVLQNSGFDTFDGTHANQPDNWVKVTGTAGTDYAKETSVVFGSSAAALKLVGNAGGTGVLVDLRQTFNTTPSTTLDAGGTAYNIALYPGAQGNQFALSFWVKADVVPAAGVLTVDLVDGSGNVIADDAGTNNTTAITLSGISTSYVQKSAVFRLPASVPTTVKLRIRTTTAVSTGSNIYVDDLALAKMVQFYTAGGPWFAIFRGAAKPLIGDAWTMALSISAAGAFQRLFQKFFDIHKLGLFIPSKADASESVADTLIA
jgi:hypothetical protein